MIAARLGVNVDHVATIRQARGGVEPDPVTAASIAELAGAEGITIHLREDRRHIQDRDLALIRQTVKTTLNLEMAATAEMVAIACNTLPEVVTLVPEKRQELTTEGGLDVVGNAESLQSAIATLKAAGIRVSLFIDPDRDQVEKSVAIGADAVEIHTGTYCDAPLVNRDVELQKIAESARLASRLGLHVHAGHGLDYNNIKPVAAIPEIVEFNIGHSIISRSVFTGLDQAVREMIVQIEGARRR